VKIIAIQKVWHQTSCEMHSVESTRALVINPETTISELLQWADDEKHALGKGDIIIVTEVTKCA